MTLDRQTAALFKPPAQPLGELKDWRVWKRGTNGKTDNAVPHWYFPAHSREGAINAAARALRLKPDQFEA